MHGSFNSKYFDKDFSTLEKNQLRYSIRSNLCNYTMEHVKKGRKKKFPTKIISFRNSCHNRCCYCMVETQLANHSYKKNY